MRASVEKNREDGLVDIKFLNDHVQLDAMANEINIIQSPFDHEFLEEILKQNFLGELIDERTGKKVLNFLSELRAKKSRLN